MNQNSKLYTHIRNTFFSETSIGISGNSILLLFRVFTSCCEHKPRLTDMLVGILALAHLLMLLVASIIAADIFMFRQGWNDITCKFIIFLYKFFRGLSVCGTCLLSILQAIILSPRHSCLAMFKKKLFPHYTFWSLFVLCSIYSSFSNNLLISTVIISNETSDNLLYVTKSCSILHLSFPMKFIMPTLLIFRDAFFLGVMVLSSGYMVTLLCRHKKQTKHLHNTRLYPKASPEQRATWTILLLMSFFVVISVLDIFMLFSRHLFKVDPIFYLIEILISHSFASVSPFVFISTEKDIIGLLRSMYERRVTI